MVASCVMNGIKILIISIMDLHVYKGMIGNGIL